MDLTTTGTAAVGKMEPKRLAAIAYVVLAFTLAMFLTRITSLILGAVRINDTSFFGIAELSISSIVGFVIAATAGILLWTNPRTHGASIDIATELKRVTWPSFAETRVSTVAVIVASVVAALILFVFDFFSSKIMTEWMPALLGWFARL